MLREIARAALEPFFDATLAGRVRAAQSAWQAEIEAETARGFGTVLADDELRVLDRAARLAVRDLRQRFATLMEGFDAGVDIEPPDLPEPRLPERQPPPLVSSEMSLLKAIRVLKARKYYGGTP